MATFTRLQALLASTAVATLGSATLLALLAGNALTLAGASENAVGPDFPICHTPVTKGLPGMMLRLAQTEVPRAEMSAANTAPAFADTEPPLWTGLGSVTYKISTTNERAQAYFDQGLRLAYAFNHGEAQRAFRMTVPAARSQRKRQSTSACPALVSAPQPDSSFTTMVGPRRLPRPTRPLQAGAIQATLAANR